MTDRKLRSHPSLNTLCDSHLAVWSTGLPGYTCLSRAPQIPSFCLGQKRLSPQPLCRACQIHRAMWFDLYILVTCLETTPGIKSPLVQNESYQ